MKPLSRFLPLVLLVPTLVFPPEVRAQDAPPPQLEAAEIERSMECVNGLAILRSVREALEPLSERSDRIVDLNRAIALEDAARVQPFSGNDPVEVAVRDWFEADLGLAERIADGGGDDLVEARRDEAREEIRRLLAETYDDIARQADEVAESTEGLREASRRCDGAVLLRPAVLEACESLDSPACQAARADVEADDTPDLQVRFVDTAEQLWGITRLRPWSSPTRIGPSLDGELTGGRTSVSTQQGNAAATVSLEPLILKRGELDAGEDAEHSGRLDELGFVFGHPDLVLVPVLGVQVDLPALLAGEERYVLHLGESPDVPGAVLHSFGASSGGRTSDVVPVTSEMLQGLAAGEFLFISAVGPPDPDAGPLGGERLYTLEFSDLLQVRSVNNLMIYWAEGGLSDDLLELIPPS